MLADREQYSEIVLFLMQWFSCNSKEPLKEADYQAAMISAGLMEFDTYKLLPSAEKLLK